VISEWMKVMLEEISRKKDEEERSRLEEQRRLEEGRHDARESDDVVLQSAQCTS